MQIPEIKQRLSIQEVLNHYNLIPDRNNRINCPFHDDGTPSMQIYPETNTAYCFSSNCKTHGKSLDVIDFIMNMENTDKHKAILAAKRMLSVSEIPQGGTINKAKTMTGSTPNTQSTNTPITKNKSTNTEPEENNTEIYSTIYNYFRNGFIMRKDNKARNYLQARNLDISKLENLGVSIGYNSAQFHHRNRISDEDMKACERSGLLIKSDNGSKTEYSYKPWASHCAIFPLTDDKGTITGMYGRSTSDSSRNKHYYLKNSKGLYHYPKKDTKKLIITESIIDFLSIYQADEIRAQFDFLPIYGTNRLNEAHKIVIAKLEQLEEIIFFLDGDKAGEKAQDKYSEELHELMPGVKISKVPTPEGEDINSLLDGHEPEIFTHLLEKREDIFLSIEKENNPNYQISTSSNYQIKLNTENPELLLYNTEELRITILGGIRISGMDRLKVTLKIERKTPGAQPIRHSLDLYHARQTEQLTEMISAELDMSTSKTKETIGELTSELEHYRQNRLEALKPRTKEDYKMSDQETQDALRYLKNPELMQHTQRDIAACGIIGEENNAMTGYIVNLSRKREKPLHVMYLGASGSGKTHLQEGLALLVPAEDRIEATGLSDQSLYYEGLKLKGKILFIEDLDGAENVIYIIRELQSKGKISKRVAWRDNKGNTKTVEVVAEGPVVISSCTTRERLYEDNANRCILLYIDQSPEQDKKVMDYIKEKSTGNIIESKQELIRLRMQNLQRMLRPVKVYNPYASHIELPPEVFKPRRSLPLLLGFIETVTFYHQYQRELKHNAAGETYIESTYEDVKQGFELMKNVLFSKSDELSKAARDFFEKLKAEIKPGQGFYTKEIRSKFRISSASVKRYMAELQAYGYIKNNGGNRYRGFEYKITDYEEYTRLRQGIENRLDSILQKIRKISGSVAHSGSQVQMSHLRSAIAVS
jgi:DNA primase catalytic core